MGEQPVWMDALDERQRNEVWLALLYAKDFHHGTDGHNRLVLLARLAKLLDVLEAQGADVQAAVERLKAIEEGQ